MKIENPFLRFLAGLATLGVVCVALPYGLGCLVLRWGNSLLSLPVQVDWFLVWTLGFMATAAAGLVGIVAYVVGEWLFGPKKSEEEKDED